jgi:hypothetical protein
MSRFKLIAFTLLAGAGAAYSHAAAPARVGDMFLVASEQFRGMGTTDLIYFATDGSFQLLSEALYDGPGSTPKYQPSQGGTYTYAVTPGNPNEATLTLSAGVSYTLEFETALSGALLFGTGGGFTFYQAQPNSFLANVSNRVVLRPTDTAVTGFVIQGGDSRLVLVRTVGPTLSQFGVTPVCPNPGLGLFSGVGSDKIAMGEVWGSATKFDATAFSWIFGKAGAFQLKPGSTDVVYFGLLSPGTYTAQAFDATVGAAGGSALVEVYILPYSSTPGATTTF